MVVLIWGANFVLMKNVFAQFDPMAFNTIRMTLASVVLFLSMLAREGWQPLPVKDALKIAGLGLLGNGIYQMLFITGLYQTTSGISSLLIGTSPIWAALLALLLRLERVYNWIWLGIALAFGGVALVTLSGPSAEPKLLSGDLLTLIAATCWAGYTVFSKDLLQRYSPLRVSALALIPGIVGLWAVGWSDVLRQDWLAVSGTVWGTIGYSGVLSIALSYLIWSGSIQQVGVARTAIYNNAVPLVTLALAHFTLHEPVTVFQLGGFALVLLGIWTTNRQAADALN
jgi:drug/metabolite transporter (DMT)-like permease